MKRFTAFVVYNSEGDPLTYTTSGMRWEAVKKAREGYTVYDDPLIEWKKLRARGFVAVKFVATPICRQGRRKDSGTLTKEGKTKGSGK